MLLRSKPVKKWILTRGADVSLQVPWGLHTVCGYAWSRAEQSRGSRLLCCNLLINTPLKDLNGSIDLSVGGMRWYHCLLQKENRDALHRSIVCGTSVSRISCTVFWSWVQKMGFLGNDKSLSMFILTGLSRLTYWFDISDKAVVKEKKRAAFLLISTNLKTNGLGKCGLRFTRLKEFSSEWILALSFIFFLLGPVCCAELLVLQEEQHLTQSFCPCAGEWSDEVLEVTWRILPPHVGLVTLSSAGSHWWMAERLVWSCCVTPCLFEVKSAENLWNWKGFEIYIPVQMYFCVAQTQHIQELIKQFLQPHLKSLDVTACKQKCMCKYRYLWFTRDNCSRRSFKT